jgi:hypothetical protein
MKELAVADRVRKTNPDFIVPLRADDVSFDDFPVEILRQNAITFTHDWATGLINLLEYLDKQDIPKTSMISDMNYAVSRWKEINTFKTFAPIRSKDHYYSNLFPCELPNSLIIYGQFVLLHLDLRM